MAPVQRRKISVNVLVPFLTVILFFSIMVWHKYRASHDVPKDTTPIQGEAVRTVTLFFGLDGTRLVREARDIDPCTDDAACLKDLLDELLSGPVGDFQETVPDGTIVTSARIEGGQAVVEFNGTFAEALPSGSSAEMLAVYSVVNTITSNFPQVQRVKLSIEGDGGTRLRHLDLSEPLTPDYSLEQALSPTPAAKGNGTLPGR